MTCLFIQTCLCKIKNRSLKGGTKSHKRLCLVHIGLKPRPPHTEQEVKTTEPCTNSTWTTPVNIWVIDLQLANTDTCNISTDTDIILISVWL